jgi:hypothetical protein
MYRLGDTALAIAEINKIISKKDLDQKKREEYAEVLKNIENPEIIQESNYLAVNKSPYKLNLLNDHMLVFVMPKENSDMNYLMSVFSDFNKKEFSTQTIEVSSLMMGLDQHILIIKTHSLNSSCRCFLLALQKQAYDHLVNLAYMGFC